MPARIIATLRYRDARAAIDWLCEAFGFEIHALHADGDVVHHAQLAFGADKGDMIMVSSDQSHDNGFQAHVTAPEPGAKHYATAYVIIEDVDAHHDRAAAKGADIILPLHDADYGGRHYSCRDPEGYVWSFGSYDPWAEAAPRYKPVGHNDASPYLIVPDARGTAAFLEATFGATVLGMMEAPDGRVGHTEVRVGDSVVMFGEAPGGGGNGGGAHVHVYVPDVDAAYARALQAGGTSFQAPVQKDDPDRRAGVTDPFGTTWWMGTRVG